MKFEGDVTLNSLVRRFQHGFTTLSRSSGLHLSVTGLLGIAGLVLALKDSKLGKLSNLQWLPKNHHGEPNFLLVPGLQNLGKNCFLNVILQALASCSYFQPFLEKILEESEVLAVEDSSDCVPLTISLAALFEELCAVGGGRVVLSPRQVMFAMAHYIENFDLTSEQDAAEAFLHLLSSLREEFSDFYCPNQGSIVEVLASNGRIITPKRVESQSEQERWKQHFFGPFDGILGSILTCRSCSSEISLNFESFHSLPLSPVLNGGATIMAGCTLEDCLKQFTAAEQVQNYRCSHCWHIAAVKYLLSMGGNETAVEKIECCTEENSCDCQRLFHLETLPWSNRFSRTLKQISIARCPKILCIHLKRVSVNVFGEFVKLRGHISFPLVLDLSSFMTSRVGIKSGEKNWKTGRVQLQSENPSPQPNHFNLEYDPRRLNIVQGLARGCTYQELNTSCDSVPLDMCLYRLVAVVEHFGRAGSGHYTVYRSVWVDLCGEQPGDQFDASTARWFSISDAEVCSVSKEHVLGAEASLLFYERYQG
ncbi:PREDICTED: ubiquitin carboxyl-terminal hydrolase 27 isoform X1 [Fragaria vesca subsp. vesca]|uniref:ubiquitin carboxyl-terminal hydrolase 27 isoform X1 n=1 Tax=Fragaria vesca subsp. vesca TaxID=101020 RepID=UPI0002C3279B|nr:PREDICTED: ubiquitin carboxyl-terminal hydrolase 27 isoform X1 [Fragaria vesca subsp. vesca]